MATPPKPPTKPLTPYLIPPEQVKVKPPNRNPEKVALITGSTSGIGASIAEHLFVNHKYKVVLVGSNEEKLKEMDKKLIDKHPNRYSLHPVHIDLSDLNNAELIVRKTIDKYGRIDVLINSVGIYEETCPFDGTSFDAYLKMTNINVASIVRTTLHAVPYLQRTMGNIIFISGVASVKPAINGFGYRMNKAAISMFAKCLANDMAPMSVRVNTISPGHTDTPFIRSTKKNKELSTNQLNIRAGRDNLLGRMAMPDEISTVINFILSEEASFISGAEIFVDGGATVKI